jgi:Xaa-Pro aminopeptidase
MIIPNSLLKERLGTVESRLGEQGLNYLIVFSNGSNSGTSNRTHGYLRYLCDWDSQSAPSVLVLILGKEPILLVPNSYYQRLAMENLWFQDIRKVPTKRLGPEIVSILQPLVSANEKIGYIGRAETPAPLYDALLQGLPDAEWIQADRIVNELRTIKDPVAITFHRRAAEICDAMFETLTRAVRKGKKAYQLRADVEHTAKYEGCDYVSTFLPVGPVVDRARRTRRECLRVPQPGDQLVLAVFLIYEGHWGHAIRTGTVGKPSDAQRRAFDLALEMEEAALENVKPGLDLNAVWKASASVFKKYYPNTDSSNWIWLRTGHGIGLDYSDPILTEAFRYPYEISEEGDAKDQTGEMPIQIEPGMLLELHPNVFIPNEAAGAIGDMVLVTEDGNEILNGFPRELIIY